MHHGERQVGATHLLSKNMFGVPSGLSMQGRGMNRMASLAVILGLMYASPSTSNAGNWVAGEFVISGIHKA